MGYYAEFDGEQQLFKVSETPRSARSGPSPSGHTPQALVLVELQGGSHDGERLRVGPDRLSLGLVMAAVRALSREDFIAEVGGSPPSSAGTFSKEVYVWRRSSTREGHPILELEE